LGPPSDESKSLYKTENENIFIHYSSFPCSKVTPLAWNVPLDTVISLSVYPKVKLHISELNVDLTKYQKSMDHLPDLITYTNIEEGFAFNVSNEVVMEFFYQPTAKDAHLRCMGKDIKDVPQRSVRAC